MELRFQYDCLNIQWENVVGVLESVGMSLFNNAEKIKEKDSEQ